MIEKWMHVITNLLLVLVGSVIALFLLCILWLQLDERYAQNETTKIYASGQRFENHCFPDIYVRRGSEHDCA